MIQYYTLMLDLCSLYFGIVSHGEWRHCYDIIVILLQHNMMMHAIISWGHLGCV